VSHTDARSTRGTRAVKASRDTIRATRHEALRMTHSLARAVLRNGPEALVELSEAVVQKWERTQPPYDYRADPDWEPTMHEIVGAVWPCAETAAFEEVYDGAIATLRGRGIVVGPDAFVGWCDGDPATARALWCLTRHLRPTNAVETGVARGVTTRVILEAMERNGYGRLWSIDLPPQLRPHQNHEIAAAVPADRRERWTLVEGSSRRKLPPLLDRLGTIELFVHDSRHTTQTLRFELARVWSHLAAGGVAVADDIDLNHGLPSFLATTKGYRDIVAPARLADEHRRYGRDLFAIVCKEPG
jgi:predicted O-methyltransferase YrrM